MNEKQLVYTSFSILALLICLITIVVKVKYQQFKGWSAIFSSSLCASVGLHSAISLSFNVVFTQHVNIPSCFKSFTLLVVLKMLQLVCSFNLVTLAFDRYLAICWPLRYYSLITKTRSRLLVLACWVLPCLLLMAAYTTAAPEEKCEDQSRSWAVQATYGTCYCLGAVCALLLYLLVALEFWNKKSDWYRRSRTRSSFAAALVFCLFTVCSLPHAIVPLAIHGHNDLSLFRLRNIANYINRVHIVLFLPVYAWTYTGVWRALFRCCVVARGRNNTTSSRATSQTGLHSELSKKYSVNQTKGEDNYIQDGNFEVKENARQMKPVKDKIYQVILEEEGQRDIMSIEMKAIHVEADVAEETNHEAGETEVEERDDQDKT